MKTIYAVLLAFILTFELHAQTNFYNHSQFNLEQLKLKNSAGKFRETNYHIGIDYAPVINVSETYTFRDYVHALWGYYDVSIAEKILYFRLETGVIADWKFNGGAGFAAIGVNYRIKKFNRHLIYLLFGLEGWASGSHGGFFGIINPKYVFMLSNGLGLSIGVRYMPRIGFDPFEIQNGVVCISAGVQFFY